MDEPESGEGSRSSGMGHAGAQAGGGSCARMGVVTWSAASGDAELVEAARAGDSDAFGHLVQRWFDRCYDVARSIVRNADTAADVTQDALIKAWERLDQLDDPAAFGGWLLRITHNLALDQLRRDARTRPVDTAVVTGMHDLGAPEPGGSRPLPNHGDPAEVIADADRDEILNAAAVALGEKDASLLGLHLRHGLTPAEIADELGVSPNVAHQRLHRMRHRLGDAIGALALWHHGQPSCPVLADLLEAESEFDSDTLAAVERHRRDCDECNERRAALVAPHQLFTALPLAVIPLALKDHIAAGLASAGVPATGLAATPITGPAGSGQGGSGSGEGGTGGSGWCGSCWFVDCGWCGGGWFVDCGWCGGCWFVDCRRCRSSRCGRGRRGICCADLGR